MAGRVDGDISRRPVPPDVERPAIKWDDQGNRFCELEKQITILRWYSGFIVVLLIYALFFK